MKSSILYDADGKRAKPKLHQQWITTGPPSAGAMISVVLGSAVLAGGVILLILSAIIKG